MAKSYIIRGSSESDFAGFGTDSPDDNVATVYYPTMAEECKITPIDAFAASSNMLPAATLESFAPETDLLDSEPTQLRADMVNDRACHYQTFGSVTLGGDITIDEVTDRIAKGEN